MKKSSEIVTSSFPQTAAVIAAALETVEDAEKRADRARKDAEEARVLADRARTMLMSLVDVLAFEIGRSRP